MPRNKMPRQHETYAPRRVSGLRASSEQKRQDTVDRLKAAIRVLQSRQAPVTLAAIVREGGPAWTTIKRNEEAREEWEKHKPKPKTKAKVSDPLLSSSRADLIKAVREERARLVSLQARLNAEAQAHAVTTSRYQNALAALLPRDEKIAQLEADLARYRQHLGNLRDSLNRAEQT